jgi:O-antigen/teichoic acid export membrane protein
MSRVGAAAVAVGLAGIAVNALAYAVPLLAARALSPGDLGALAAALALAGIATVAGVGLQTAVAVRRARCGVVRARRVTLVTAAVVVGVLVAATPLVALTLHLSAWVAPVIGATAGGVVLASRWLGELQGAQRFRTLAFGMGLLALGRFGGVIVGLVTGAGVIGSLALGAAATFACLPLLARWARSAAGDPAMSESDDPADLAPLGRGVMSASGATLAMLTASYADLILARHYLSAADSGAYAVGAVLTKGALWAPAVVSVIALPKMALGSARTLRVGMVLVAACGILLVGASALMGELAITLAGGSDYLGLAPQAPMFAAIGALYALAFLFINARIAAGVRWPSVPLWIATAVLFGAVALLEPPTIGRIVTCAVVTAIIATAVMGVAALRRRPSPAPAPGGRPS